jgi:hypothetical protein
MPVKRCGPLKLVKRKKENDLNKYEENGFSSPTKKVKSLNNQKVNIFKYLVILVLLVVIDYFRSKT